MGRVQQHRSSLAFLHCIRTDIRLLEQRTILPTTPFDNKLDRESINPRFQASEKFISGLYLSEITRNILLHLIDHCPPLLFSGLSTPTLNTHYGFDTAYMSEIEEAEGSNEERNRT